MIVGVSGHISVRVSLEGIVKLLRLGNLCVGADTLASESTAI